MSTTVALMSSRLRGHDGQPLWSAATFRQAGGITQVFGPEAVAFEPLRHRASPCTGIAYPLERRVRIGPRLFQLQPLMDDEKPTVAALPEPCTGRARCGSPMTARRSGGAIWR